MTKQTSTTRNRILGAVTVFLVVLGLAGLGFAFPTAAAVVGVVVAVIAIIAALSWANYMTNGAVTAMLLFWSL